MPASLHLLFPLLRKLFPSLSQLTQILVLFIVPPPGSLPDPPQQDQPSSTMRKQFLFTWLFPPFLGCQQHMGHHVRVENPDRSLSIPYLQVSSVRFPPNINFKQRLSEDF